MVIAILLGFRDIELVTILMVVGVPVGTATVCNCLTKMGADSELAAQLIVLGTCVSACNDIFMDIYAEEPCAYSVASQSYKIYKLKKGI